MNLVYLLTGSNLGDKANKLGDAIKKIEEHCGKILRQSHLYETAAWGIEDQPSFYNQVLLLETNMHPTELMQSLLQIEKNLGRTPTFKMGPRVIDIDILLYNDLTISNEIVTIPHPHLHNRRFVLTPLNELASEMIHPVLKKSIQQLLEDCEDSLSVKLVSN